MARNRFVASMIGSVSALIFAAQPVMAQDGVTRTGDIVFAEVDGRELMLDLYTPTGAENAPVLIFAHGGGWARGSRERVPHIGLVPAGYAIASVDYRLSGEAKFPAQIHDLKAAVRYLRANASKLGIDANRVGATGSSAGAHLAQLLGLTNGSAEHEGDVGEFDNVSSDVSVVVSYYGASNFTTILDQSTEYGYGVRAPALDALLGGSPEAEPELARLASPIFYADASDPPMYLLHGDQDPQMPINQTHEIHGKYKSLGLPVHFEVVHGAAHGGELFYDHERTAMVQAFLDAHFMNGD
jgi:acetyl esterase/lipase